MLADGPISNTQGRLASGVIEEGRSRELILDFVLAQLPVWRDRPDRAPRTNETQLTSQLCAHLNGAARKVPGWDCYQFRVEETDDVQSSRKVDLVASPAGEVLIVEGRAYSDFDTILPIECKRLPTPPGAKREAQEYVATTVGSKGGIQRYKEGKHGAGHQRAALIAYVQEESFDHWLNQIRSWILDLCTACTPGWSPDDTPVNQSKDDLIGVAVHESRHSRVGLPEISLRHLWIRMS